MSEENETVSAETQEMLKRMDLIPDRAKFAAALLALAFKWDQSAEGREFWRDVYRKLYLLAKAGGANMADMKLPSLEPSKQTSSMIETMLELQTPRGNVPPKGDGK
jgi:hypothetical protein